MKGSRLFEEGPLQYVVGATGIYFLTKYELITYLFVICDSDHLDFCVNVKELWLFL